MKENIPSTLPLGEVLPHWQPVQTAFAATLTGQYCRLEKLHIPTHAEALFNAYAPDAEGKIWTYLAFGPFKDFPAFTQWLQSDCLANDPCFYAICDAQGAIGLASYMRIDRANGVVEIGNLVFSPRLQRTTAATEALYLMLEHAFALGYRRVEWKCNNLNQPSKSAALRLGMTFEGVFRQAAVVKGRNRDTAWYSMLDGEWTGKRLAYQQWLRADNFDAQGQQLQTLGDLMGK